MLNPDLVKPFLYVRKEELGSQGLETPVLYRIVELDHIKQINMDGEELVIKEQS